MAHLGSELSKDPFKSSDGPMMLQIGWIILNQTFSMDPSFMQQRRFGLIGIHKGSFLTQLYLTHCGKLQNLLILVYKSLLIINRGLNIYIHILIIYIYPSIISSNGLMTTPVYGKPIPLDHGVRKACFWKAFSF